MRNMALRQELLTTSPNHFAVSGPGNLTPRVQLKVTLGEKKITHNFRIYRWQQQ